MSLTLREVRLEDLGAFQQWRRDPRYSSMLRRPGQPALDEEQLDWYHRMATAGSWWAIIDADRDPQLTELGRPRLRGYVLLTPRGVGCAEVSVLTDPDHPCDTEALLLLEAEARSLGIRRLFGETYTAERAALVRGLGYQEVAHWTKLL